MSERFIFGGRVSPLHLTENAHGDLRIAQGERFVVLAAEDIAKLVCVLANILESHRDEKENLYDVLREEW